MSGVTKLVAHVPMTADLWGDMIDLARIDAAVIGDTPPTDEAFAAFWRCVKEKPARMLADAQRAWPDHDWSEFE